MKFLNWLFSWKSPQEEPSVKIARGDLIELAKANNFDVIIHGCNCFHAMAGGIARAIRVEWPEAAEADNKTRKGDENKLGTYSSVPVNGHEEGAYAPYEVLIVNAYTQFNPGADVNYDAIRNCLRKIHKDFPMDIQIGIPRIGAGIAGGDWQKIEDMIVTELPDRFVTIVAFIPE